MGAEPGCVGPPRSQPRPLGVGGPIIRRGTSSRPNATQRGLWIAVEGLDGTGKSTLCVNLTRTLDAVHLKNPPVELREQRARADSQPEPQRRAFYRQANDVVTAQAVEARAKGRWVVMDRSLASTLAFGAAWQGQVANEADWPRDTPRPDFIILLLVPDPIRQRRAKQRRIGETPEEKRLRCDETFRASVLAGYRNLGAQVVDASGTPEEVTDFVLELFRAARIGRVAGSGGGH